MPPVARFLQGEIGPRRGLSALQGALQLRQHRPAGQSGVTEGKSRGWIMEKVSFAAAYGDERVIAYLFLPRQPALPGGRFLPGEHPPCSHRARISRTSTNSRCSSPLSSRVAGRPFIPSTKGHSSITPAVAVGGPRRRRGLPQRMELVIQMVKDFRRCIDYLESRSDIDAARIAYKG